MIIKWTLIINLQWTWIKWPIVVTNNNSKCYLCRIKWLIQCRNINKWCLTKCSTAISRLSTMLYSSKINNIKYPLLQVVQRVKPVWQIVLIKKAQKSIKIAGSQKINETVPRCKNRVMTAKMSKNHHMKVMNRTREIRFLIKWTDRKRRAIIFKEIIITHKKWNWSNR